MPKITTLNTVVSISSATTFVVIDNGLTRRYAYGDLKTKLNVSSGGGFATTSTLVNGTSTVSLGSDGLLTFPGNFIIGTLWPNNPAPSGDKESVIWAKNDTEYLGMWWGGAQTYPAVNYGPVAGIMIGPGDVTGSTVDDFSATGPAPTGTNITLAINSATSIHQWIFDRNGGLTFPDNTKQTTAYTGGAGGTSNSFGTIAVSGQSNVVADSATDTLTLIAGTNVTITTNATTDSITINASGGGGFATTSTLVNGTSTVTLSSTGTLTLPVSGDIVRNGVSVLGGGGTTLPSQSGNSGKYLTTNGSSLSWATVAGGGFSRSVSTGTTTGIPNGSTNNITITGFKSYSLLSVQTSAAAWVRLYTTSAARSSDSSRSQGTDPTPGAGVIAEIITTGTQIQLITPGVIGFNNDDPPATTIYAAVANLSGGYGTISVTLKLLQLEA